MKAFLTGATGFVGCYFVETLLKQGHDVYALYRDPVRLKRLDGLNAHCLQGDLCSIPSLPADLDYIFHLAGLTKARKSGDYYTVNKEGTASLLRHLASQGLRAKFVYLSSLAAGGPSTVDRPRKEEDPPEPVSHYGKSKLLAEQEVLAFKERFPVLVLRPGPIYGPRDEDFLEYFKHVRRGILPYMAGRDTWLSLCHVRDLSRALDLCIQKPWTSGDVFNIGDRRPTSWLELGRTAARVMGRRARALPVPKPAVFLAALVSDLGGRLTGRLTQLNLYKFQEMKHRYWMADMEKSQRVLGYESVVPLEEGLAETLAWYKEAGWL